MPSEFLDGASRQKASPPCPYCAGIGVLEATDMFCGAGGSSLGLEHVCCPLCGRQLIVITQALNHWALAVEAHNANFPDADHDVHDVQDIQPSRFRRTPLFWASPECVYYTSCRGKKDDSDAAVRSRATFRDVRRFTEYHHYDAVIVENVIEARLWCEHEGCRCGAEFDAWMAEMCALGYEAQIVYFNSQFALPTPQSRDRMYVVFWRNGLMPPMLDFSPMAWCSSCQAITHGTQTWKPASRGSIRDLIPTWGRYGANYIYACTNEGCGQPVAPAVFGAKTIVDWDLPIERIGDRKFKNGKKRDLAPNTRKRIRVGYENMGRRRPIALQVGGNLFERDGYARVWSLDQPLKTVTATSYTALCMPERSGNVPRSVEEPTDAVAGRSQLGLITRVGGQSQNGNGRSLGEPMNTILGNDRQVGLVLQNMENNVGRSTDEPIPPVTTGGNQMLVQVNRGPKGAGDNRGGGRSVAEPTRTIAGHGELGLVEFRGEWGTVRDGRRPAHTVTAEGTHHGMLVYNGMPGFVRDLGDTAGTVTARDKQSLLVPFYRTGVARDVAEPMGAVTSRNREALVISEADIDDCYFRMLQWPELLRAQMMHMHADGKPYELTARRRDKRGKMVELSNELRTKMIGNAVSSPVATMLGHAVMEILR